MSNMSYCRWENTYRDLNDCYQSMLEEDEELSESEAMYKKLLLEVAKKMVAQSEEDGGDE